MPDLDLTKKKNNQLNLLIDEADSWPLETVLISFKEQSDGTVNQVVTWVGNTGDLPPVVIHKWFLEDNERLENALLQWVRDQTRGLHGEGANSPEIKPLENAIGQVLGMFLAGWNDPTNILSTLPDPNNTFHNSIGVPPLSRWPSWWANTNELNRQLDMWAQDSRNRGGHKRVRILLWAMTGKAQTFSFLPWELAIIKLTANNLNGNDLMPVATDERFTFGRVLSPVAEPRKWSPRPLIAKTFWFPKTVDNETPNPLLTKITPESLNSDGDGNDNAATMLVLGLHASVNYGTQVSEAGASFVDFKADSESVEQLLPPNTQSVLVMACETGGPDSVPPTFGNPWYLLAVRFLPRVQSVIGINGTLNIAAARDFSQKIVNAVCTDKEDATYPPLDVAVQTKRHDLAQKTLKDPNYAKIGSRPWQFQLWGRDPSSFDPIASNLLFPPKKPNQDLWIVNTGDFKDHLAGLYLPLLKVDNGKRIRIEQVTSKEATHMPMPENWLYIYRADLYVHMQRPLKQCSPAEPKDSDPQGFVGYFNKQNQFASESFDFFQEILKNVDYLDEPQ